MNNYHIQLTEKESVLLDNIGLSPHDSNSSSNKRWRKENKDIVLQLFESLCHRNAIPEVRLKYWNDPEYQTDGRYKRSNKGMFERNNCFGQDIYIHPHFLKYLRYFLFGAYLPNSVITKFEACVEDVVGSPDYITSGDYEPISKCARSLIREYSLQDDPREEFFKLCLDMGFCHFSAETIRQNIGNIRKS